MGAERELRRGGVCGSRGVGKCGGTEKRWRGWITGSWEILLMGEVDRGRGEEGQNWESGKRKHP